tara:strand:+ start:133 stop:753 length:621 start_codon:yes stop_codon:yes gene_type:complete
MKIKLTESQYNRLLTEDTEDWGRLTDKVTPFIVKLFKLIEEKLPPTSSLNNKIKFLRDTMSLPINEALIVAYTYEQFYKENITNWDNLIGEPLQYKAIYHFNGDVPMTADMWARGYGPATIYAIAGSKEEALEKSIDSSAFVVDENSIVDDDIDWDTDIENIDVQHDMLSDTLYDISTGDPGGNPFILSTDVPDYTLHNLIMQDRL